MGSFTINFSENKILSAISKITLFLLGVAVLVLIFKLVSNYLIIVLPAVVLVLAVLILTKVITFETVKDFLKGKFS